MDTQDQQRIQSLWGEFKQSLPNFKARTAQRHLVAAGARALCSQTPGTVSVVEAPTGTGKSLGYLFAAAPAIERGEKVVIAPSTITLQEQLLNKDIPLFQKHTGLTFSFALVKGRGRYACSLKLEQALGKNLIGAPHYKALAAALDDGSWDGDFDQWKNQLGHKLRQPIAADSHDCLKKACPKLSECPYYAARARVDNATVVIANHALLATDLAMGGGQLLTPPEETRYILDEAHGFSEICADHFRRGFSLTQVRNQLMRQVNRVLKLPIPATDTYRSRRTALVEALNRTIKQLDALYGHLMDTYGHDERDNLPETTPVCRFKAGVIPKPLRSRLEALKQALATVSIAANAFAAHLQACPAQPRQRYQSAQHQVDTLAEAIELWLADTTHPVAKWVSAGGKYNNGHAFRLDAVPIRVGHMLQNRLWSRCKGALLTSGTLSALGKFDFFLEKVGLDTHKTVSTQTLPSVYKHEEKAKLYLPEHSADPKDSDAYTTYLARELANLLPSIRGSLVLFASKRQMLDTLDALPAVERMHVMCQGDSSLRDMLSSHKAEIDAGSRSTLFGLASMAEGLDLPGAYCELVVITKLPFRTPNCPVLATEHEWLNNQNRNPFFELEVPLVSQKLAQSIGRLLRTETDTGLIAILDPRIQRGGYGRALLNSIPPMNRIESVDSNELAEAM